MGKIKVSFSEGLEIHSDHSEWDWGQYYLYTQKGVYHLGAESKQHFVKVVQERSKNMEWFTLSFSETHKTLYVRKTDGINSLSLRDREGHLIYQQDDVLIELSISML